MALPPCVRFAPSDEEVIRVFLQPYVNNVFIPQCLITEKDVYQSHPSAIPNPMFSICFRPGEFWYFVNRGVKGPTNKIKRTVGNGNGNGRWFEQKKIAIMEGDVTIGYRQKLIFKNQARIHTGWHQFEYSINSQEFQPTVVSHLVYKAEDNQTLQHMQIEENLNDEVEVVHDAAAAQAMFDEYQEVLH